MAGFNCDGQFSAQDKINLRRAQFWMLTWVLSFSLGLIVNSKLEPMLPLKWGLALLPNLLGIQCIRCYFRFLSQADELVRKIQMEALALAFGVGCVFVIGYRMLQTIGFPPLEITWIASLLFFVWGIGGWWGMRRYR